MHYHRNKFFIENIIKEFIDSRGEKIINLTSADARRTLAEFISEKMEEAKRENVLDNLRGIH
jgi:hypothetical protein